MAHCRQWNVECGDSGVETLAYDIFWTTVVGHHVVGSWAWAHTRCVHLAAQYAHPGDVDVEVCWGRGKLLEQATDGMLASRPIRGPQMPCPGVLRGLA